MVDIIDAANHTGIGGERDIGDVEFDVVDAAFGIALGIVHIGAGLQRNGDGGDPLHAGAGDLVHAFDRAHRILDRLHRVFAVRRDAGGLQLAAVHHQVSVGVAEAFFRDDGSSHP